MSDSLEKFAHGKEVFTFIDLELDFCKNTFGVQPCTASASTGLECFNARKHCQDPTNYSKYTKAYKFCTQHYNLSKINECVNYFPCVISAPKFKSTRLNPGKGLGDLGSVTIKLQDFEHHDRGIDPYVDTRTYTPEDQGTFFTKLIARNPYYVGRKMVVSTGYLTEPYDCCNFEERTFVIESIEGPDSKGIVSITGKDILVQASDDRAQVPIASNGKLTGTLAIGGASLTLTTGEGASYGSSGTVKINAELINFSGRTGDTLTGLTKGQWGTADLAHAIGDTVQLCFVANQTNVVNIVYDFLLNYVGLPAAYLPFNDDASNKDEWDIEKADWVSTHNFTRVISKPTGIKKLVGELAEQAMFNLWWDQINELVKLKAIAPPKSNASVTTLTDLTNLVEGSVTIREDQKARLSQVWVNYDKENQLDNDEFKNFAVTYIGTDLTSEGSDLYGSARVKKINATWMDGNNSGNAAQLAGRTLARFTDPPKVFPFRLAVKDADLAIGDLADIPSDLVSDQFGASKTIRFEIIEKKPVIPGIEYAYTGLESSFTGRYGFVAPNSVGDYSSETEENQKSYAFVSRVTNDFADGTKAYKVI